MSVDDLNLELPASFSGTVKLFPLPNLVLFPGVFQPLHIFEPRYRSMLHDALEDDNLIATALIKQESTSVDESQPDIHPTVCIGKVVNHAQLSDGRCNLWLLGVARGRVIHEVESDLPYRCAKVEIVDRVRRAADSQLASYYRPRISEMFEQLALDQPIGSEILEKLSDDEVPFGMLLDLISFSTLESFEHQQRVLNTQDLESRAELVMECLDEQLAHSKLFDAPCAQACAVMPFPPGFSRN